MIALKYRNLVFICLFLINSAKADEVVPNPEMTVSTETTSEQVNQDIVPPNPGAFPATTSGAPLPETGADEAIQKTQAAPVMKFDIQEYRVTGNTLLSNTVIETAVYPFLGPQRAIEDIEQARVTLEKAYKAIGYPAVVVNIPEQTVTKGIVILDVVEGKIERVKISGSRYHSLSDIRARVPALTRGNVLYLPEVQQQLEDLNKSSQDRSVTPVLRPGRAPGTVEVELMVKDEFPFHGNLELNNQHTIDTTPTRAGVSLRYDNLFQKQHSVSLQYQTSPEEIEEVNVYALTYLFPISYPADRMVVYAINTDSSVTTIGDLSVLGNGKILGLRWIKSLAGTNSYFHNFSIGVDYKDFEDVQSGTTFPISYWPLSLRYDGSSASEKSLFQFNVGAVLGTPLNAKQDEFSAKRYGSTTNFFYLKTGFSYKYVFANGAEMRLKADAQLATSPLISNEQFSAGGASTVRGYYESQVLNDSGINATLEAVSARLLANFSMVNDLRILWFYDGSHTDRIDPLPGEVDQSDIAGTGLGLRIRLFDSMNAELDAAVALKDMGGVEKNDMRWHFKLNYEF